MVHSSIGMREKDVCWLKVAETSGHVACDVEPNYFKRRPVKESKTNVSAEVAIALTSAWRALVLVVIACFRDREASKRVTDLACQGSRRTDEADVRG